MSRKKVLLVATVQSHICQFHLPLIDMLHEMGYEVHIAAKNNLAQKNGLKLENADKVYDIPFERSPLSLKNIKAYKILKNIVKENQYSIIHCNTPVGGVISRLVGKKYRKNGMKLIYTAHGFHFYKGAKKRNWIIYYPIEKILSRYTDAIITINEEDYKIAKDKFKAKNVYKINGTGVNTEKFKKITDQNEIKKIKDELNIDSNDFVIVCIGELNNNKNQILQINAIEVLKEQYPNIKLFLCGNGPLNEYYENIIKNKNLQNNIFLLGYRRDVNRILSIANCAITTSIREGLGLNVIEAMSSEVVVIASNNRGHREIITDGYDGYLVALDNINELKNKIEQIIKNTDQCFKISKNASDTAKKFSNDNVIKQLKRIYLELK